MAGRLDEETYLSEIGKMSPEQLQRYKEQIRGDMESGRIGAKRTTGNILGSLFTGGLAGLVLGSVSTTWVSSRKPIIGWTVGVITGLAAAAIKFFSLRKEDRLHADRQNNHLLTHIERVEAEKLQEMEMEMSARAPYSERPQQQDGRDRLGDAGQYYAPLPREERMPPLQPPSSAAAYGSGYAPEQRPAPDTRYEHPTYAGPTYASQGGNYSTPSSNWEQQPQYSSYQQPGRQPSYMEREEQRRPEGSYDIPRY